MVTLRHSAASRRMLRALRLLLPAAALLFASVTADAQGRRAHLSTISSNISMPAMRPRRRSSSPAHPIKLRPLPRATGWASGAC